MYWRLRHTGLYLPDFCTNLAYTVVRRPARFDACGGHDLCAQMYDRLHASEKPAYRIVTSEEHAQRLRKEATKFMVDELCSVATAYGEHSVNEMRPVLLPARLSGSRAEVAKGGRLPEGGLQRLAEAVRECSASIDAEHGDRDAEADKRGYCELYARHWQDKALDQQQAETESRAWWWRAGRAPKSEDSLAPYHSKHGDAPTPAPTRSAPPAAPAQPTEPSAAVHPVVSAAPANAQG